MLKQQTLNRLRELRLPGMSAAYEEEQRQGDAGQMSFDDRFGLLVEKEWSLRQERRTQRRLKDAHLKEQAWLEDADLDSARGLSRELARELGTCNWIRAKKNLLVTGPTGTGKTWVSCALANKACREGLTSYYARVPRLIHELAVARLDGSFLKMLAKLAKVDLLILDDFGLCPLEQEAQHSLLELIDDRVSARSTIVTSQLPVENWYGTFTDPTVAEALLDRLLGHSQKVKLTGPSRRPRTDKKGKEG